MAGREFGKKRKEKSFSFSVFPGWRRELLSAPVKLLGPGSCFLSSLFGPDQKRPGDWLGCYCSLLVCFFRWRRTSPTFQVPQRVKFLPLPTGTVLTSTWPYRSQVRTSKEFTPWLQLCRSGKTKRPRRSMKLRLFLFLPRRQLQCARRIRALRQVTSRLQTDSNWSHRKTCKIN